MCITTWKNVSDILWSIFYNIRQQIRNYPTPIFYSSIVHRANCPQWPIHMKFFRFYGPYYDSLYRHNSIAFVRQEVMPKIHCIPAGYLHPNCRHHTDCSINLCIQKLPLFVSWHNEIVSWHNDKLQKMLKTWFLFCFSYKRWELNQPLFYVACKIW